MTKNIWRTITCLCVLFVGIAYSDNSTDLANSVVDGLLQEIYTNIQSDPLRVDIARSLGRSSSGKVKVTECEVYNMTSAYRSKDAQSKVVGNDTKIKATIKFNDAELKCGYSLSLLDKDLTSGQIEFKVPELEAKAKINLSSSNEVSLHSLKLSSRGLIDDIPGWIIDAGLSMLGFNPSLVKLVFHLLSSMLTKVIKTVFDNDS